MFDVATRGRSETTGTLVAAMFSLGRNALAQSDPVFVSREMCELVTAASQSFEPEPLLATDLFIQDGFLYFERPIPTKNRRGEPANIAAVSWTETYAFAPGVSEEVRRERKPVSAISEAATPEGMADALQKVEALPLKGEIFWEIEKRHQERHPEEARPALDVLVESQKIYHGVCLSLYENTTGYDWSRYVNPDLVRAMTCPVPTLLHMHSTPWWLGHTFDGNEVDENGVPTGAESWWSIVQTTLRLMQQRIAVHHEQRPDRGARREAQRSGFKKEPKVVVVRLRRESSERHVGESEPANYSHRFIVSGHWRNQWYPSGQVHRQIWISPYVKGPEDAPLRVPPRKVYQWTR